MRVRLAQVVVLVLTSGILVLAGTASASNPPSGFVTVPTTSGQTASNSWIGTIPVGSNPTSDCNGFPQSDSHVITINAPAAYTTVDAEFRFSISWTPGPPPGTPEDVRDEILTVIAPDGTEVGSSDSSATTETVVANNLPSGNYTVLACGFINLGPQDYNGSLTVTTTAHATETSLPSAPAQGLQFSAAMPADNQRDEAEPLMEIDKAGNTYTCGPTGFSNASDYAQVSTDGGDQYHLLGSPPRGQQGVGGGGDCSLATGITRNSQGNFQYAYAGLGPLTGFVTSTSPEQRAQPDDRRPVRQRRHRHRRRRRPPVDDVHRRPQRPPLLQPAGAAEHRRPEVDRRRAHLRAHMPRSPRRIRPSRGRCGTTPPATSSSSAGTSGARRPNGGDAINLSLSRDGGTTWTMCRAANAPSDAAGFVVADNDNAGNIYIGVRREVEVPHLPRHAAGREPRELQHASAAGHHRGAEGAGEQPRLLAAGAGRSQRRPLDGLPVARRRGRPGASR